MKKIQHQKIWSLCLIVGLLFMSGCYGKTESSTTAPVSNTNEKTHEHSDADKLFWAKKDVEQDGFLITLGHHGVHFHSGEAIEPAIMITKDGKDIADANVFNSMLAEDGTTVLVAEAKTVFEPKTEDEPAHYAQADMMIPKGTKKFIVRFKIELPGVDGAKSHDIEVSVAH